MKNNKKIYQSINICFVWAKIISDIKFEFFNNSKVHNSIVEFIAETNSGYSFRKNRKQIIFFRAYDDNADTIYREYQKSEDIKIIGNITSTYIEISEIL